MLLAGIGFEDVRALIGRGTAPDNTHPRGAAICPERAGSCDDGESHSCRRGLVREQSRCRAIRITRLVAVREQAGSCDGGKPHSCRRGFARVKGIDTSRYRPGALQGAVVQRRLNEVVMVGERGFESPTPFIPDEV
jgi:hypothetical protein